MPDLRDELHFTMTDLAVPGPYQRHDSLDLLRGVAVLGILLCNIWAFALPHAAYDNPAAYGDLQGLNYLAWWLTAVLAQEKFITLFSVLFGASLALFREHLLDRQLHATVIGYRRLAALLVFGLLHAYLLWFGDVLTVYAICGMLLYPLLRLSTPLLLALSLSLFALEYSLLWALTSTMQQLPADALQSSIQEWAPTAETLAHELAVYRSGWWTQMQHRVPEAWSAEWATLMFYGPRLCAQMLLGVLLFRTGILLAARSASFYRRAAVLALLCGLPLVIYGVERLARGAFYFDASLVMGNYWNSIGSLLVATGYAALLIRWSQRASPGVLRRALQRTGRMAFSNYLMTSLLCTSLFYGHGLAWFGHLERAELLLITIAIWLLLVLWSDRWLRRYAHGPMEWLWRWLSYGKRPAWRLSQQGDAG